jgi:hypothetical protein
MCHHRNSSIPFGSDCSRCSSLPAGGGSNLRIPAFSHTPLSAYYIYYTTSARLPEVASTEIVTSMPRKPDRSAKLQPAPLPAAAVMSFLKETRGMLTWTIKDLRRLLLITPAQVRDVSAALQLQG